MLTSIDDYQDWDKLVAHCETLEGLTDFEKARAKRALESLRNELGLEFLQAHFHQGHPLIQHLTNLAPWTRKWITQFAEDLGKVKTDPKYVELLARLKDRNRYAEAHQVLYVASRFVDSGFSVTLDAEVEVEGGRKVPDLLLADPATREMLYAEVTASTQSVIERDAFETGHRICLPLWQALPFLHYAVRIHKMLAPKHLDSVVNQVEKLVANVQQEQAFRSLAIEGVLEMGVAPLEDREILTVWAAEHGLEVGTLDGPPFSVDELARVRWKVRNKQNQLPRDRPNIVVVFAQTFFFTVGDLRNAVSELEEAVFSHPHLLGVVVAAAHMGHGHNEVCMYGEHVYIRRITSDLIVEEYLILLNRFCERRVLPSTIAKLYSAFRPR